MTTKSIIKSKLIAPCGMNCAICLGYLRDENKCDGCRSKNKKCRANCTISNCTNLKKTNSIFCSEKCEKFPCTRLKNLDKRYRTKYNMSMLENLKNIEKLGIRTFIKNEKTKWACSKCGSVICVHRGYCLNCRILKSNL